MPQVTIPANNWFASESSGNFSLVGCTVSPGFDFDDFEIANRNTLISQHSEHQKIIEQFTR
jgi:predicted cupin superfamily sugar epimerase